MGRRVNGLRGTPRVGGGRRSAGCLLRIYCAAKLDFILVGVWHGFATHHDPPKAVAQRGTPWKHGVGAKWAHHPPRLVHPPLHNDLPGAIVEVREHELASVRYFEHKLWLIKYTRRCPVFEKHRAGDRFNGSVLDGVVLRIYYRVLQLKTR